MKTIKHSEVLLIQSENFIAMHNMHEIIRRHIVSDDALDIQVSTMDRLDPKTREWFDIWLELRPGERLHDEGSTHRSRRREVIDALLKSAGADMEDLP